jgi:hypothetical protein
MAKKLPTKIQKNGVDVPIDWYLLKEVSIDGESYSVHGAYPMKGLWGALSAKDLTDNLYLEDEDGNCSQVTDNIKSAIRPREVERLSLANHIMATCNLLDVDAAMEDVEAEVEEFSGVTQAIRNLEKKFQEQEAEFNEREEDE